MTIVGWKGGSNTRGKGSDHLVLQELTCLINSNWLRLKTKHHFLLGLDFEIVVAKLLWYKRSKTLLWWSRWARFHNYRTIRSTPCHGLFFHSNTTCHFFQSFSFLARHTYTVHKSFMTPDKPTETFRKLYSCTGKNFDHWTPESIDIACVFVDIVMTLSVSVMLRATWKWQREKVTPLAKTELCMITCQVHFICLFCLWMTVSRHCTNGNAFL